MNRKSMRSEIRLAVKKETLKDLGTSKPIAGGLRTTTTR